MNFSRPESSARRVPPRRRARWRRKKIRRPVRRLVPCGARLGADVRDKLRERITSGELGPHEALPSITYLTQETGMAVGTVRRAIDVLIKEGRA